MELSKLIACKHCGNMAQMQVVGTATESSTTPDDYGPPIVYGTSYSVLKCPKCKKVNIVTYDWHEDMESEEQLKYEFLYPQSQTEPIGLPDTILMAYRSAEQVRAIDVNAYAILTRRLLEMVCLDRNAKSGSLAQMLKELSTRNEIPEKLVKVAAGLKDFGNIGAHAGSGELTQNEIPIVNALCSAILEYVYSAPHLAAFAEQKLNMIKTKASKK